MKAVKFDAYGGPEVLQVAELPCPEPGPGEVLIEMASAGLSRPDALMRTGAYPWTKGILPFYPGLYGAGTIKAVGEGVMNYRPGQSVFVDHPVVCGCCAEYKTAPARFVSPVPDGVTPDLAALMTSHIIVWGMLTECFPNAEGKTLYIRGAAGSIGTAVLQVAPLLGMRVIASAGTKEKCGYLESFKSADVFCYAGRDAGEAVLSLTGGRGADIIMDQSVGDGFCRQLDYLAPMGTILVYNHTRGFPSENVVRAMTDRFERCPSARVFSFHYFDDKPELLAEKKAAAFRLLSEGRIKPHIGGRFKLEDIVKAHELLDSGNFFGGIVINP